jgi:hypothetical protein
VPDRGENVLEGTPLGTVIMDVARCDDRKPHPVRQTGQAADPFGVSTDEVLLELHENPIGCESADETVGKRFSRCRRVFEGMQEGAPSAPREEDEAFGPFEEPVEGEGRGVPGAPPVGVGEQAAKVRVADGGFGQESDVPAVFGVVRTGGAEEGSGGELDLG